MKVRKKVLKKVKESKRLRNRLALELNRTAFSVTRWIEANDNDGPLTTVTALRVIREETGLSDDDILESVSEHQDTKI